MFINYCCVSFAYMFANIWGKNGSCTQVLWSCFLIKNNVSKVIFIIYFGNIVINSKGVLKVIVHFNMF